jgi:protein TonB
LNGEPTAVQTTINVNFTFSDSGAAVLKTATAETYPVPARVFQGLAISEPGFAAPVGAPEGAVVSLQVVVSKDGEVKEAVATFGPQQVRPAAVDGVMGWRYRPFVLNGEPREIQSTIVVEFRNGTAKRSSIPEIIGIGGVAGMSGMTGGVAGNNTNGPPPMPNGPVRVSSAVVAGQILKRVDPEYPPVARTAGVQGVVILHAILSKTGDVSDLRVISGPPMLAGAALDAVKQWKYRPYLLNGVACEVETNINVAFVLATATTPVAGASPGAPN